MKNGKKTAKLQRVVAMVLLLVTMVLFVPTGFVFAEPELPCITGFEEIGEEEEGPVYEWRYMMVGNVLYRRLYDVTNGVWVTEWEPC